MCGNHYNIFYGWFKVISLNEVISKFMQEKITIFIFLLFLVIQFALINNQPNLHLH